MDQLRAFKDVAKKKNLEPWIDWIGINVEGTTFSGHPTRTTLGNTLRQMLYFFYYIEQADPEWKEPWKVREGVPKICVSGDDVCVITQREKAEKLSKTIARLCGRDSKEKSRIGLG